MFAEESLPWAAAKHLRVAPSSGGHIKLSPPLGAYYIGMTSLFREENWGRPSFPPKEAPYIDPRYLGCPQILSPCRSYPRPKRGFCKKRLKEVWKGNLDG